MNGAESHKDFWRVGHGNAEWMFGTRNVPWFWLDNGVAHGCPNTRSNLIPGDFSPLTAASIAVDVGYDRKMATALHPSQILVAAMAGIASPLVPTRRMGL